MHAIITCKAPTLANFIHLGSFESKQKILHPSKASHTIDVRIHDSSKLNGPTGNHSCMHAKRVDLRTPANRPQLGEVHYPRDSKVKVSTCVFNRRDCSPTLPPIHPDSRARSQIFQHGMYALLQPIHNLGSYLSPIPRILGYLIPIRLVIYVYNHLGYAISISYWQSIAKR